jgi:HIV Tat-specific factor 1
LLFQGTYSVDPVTGVNLYKDSNDGMIYEWDTVKNAWFPRIDEDFMAVYQMNYGFNADG